ncbi:hypothetical protein HPP92_001961 [Vanilla planifolia]|uniref:Anther-specific protein BCP1 n=1 Tax=Vanilla planifolia TaxID=51239 RepID=A0A835RRM6_VANPL|nr:hypothetical protein HPP92_001961 [Vanilla planifolia]
MARFVIILALLALAVAAAVEAETPAPSPKPSKSPLLTPYAAVPSSFDGAAEGPSSDAIYDSDAAPIGGPSGSYPPVDESGAERVASITAVSSVATVSVAAAGFFFL